MTEDQFIAIIQKFADIQSLLVQLYLLSKNTSDANIVLSVAEVLKVSIDVSIKTVSGPLTSKDVKKIRGRGSRLSDFKTSIAVGYAVGILDEQSYHICECIREIRNILAHNKDHEMQLSMEPALSAFMRLHTDADLRGSYRHLLVDYARKVEDQIKRYVSAHRLEGAE